MIRKIEKKDVDEVINLVKEFECKRLPSTVATDLLRAALEKESHLVNAYVVECPQTEHVVGYVIYNLAYSTWTGKAMSVVSFYVRPDCNNGNMAYKLLKTLCEEAVKLNVTRIDFQVPRHSDEQSFFMKYGADDLIQENRTIYRMKRKEMVELADKP